MLATGEDSRIEDALENAIELVVAAQESDGSIHTCRSLKNRDPDERTGDERWSCLEWSHELYDRGHHDARASYGSYSQDHIPVQEQKHAVGHAVKGTCLYAAMTDLAALVDGAGFQAIQEALCEDVVFTNMHLTGGKGSHHVDEDFGAAYELPILTGCAETCASIAFANWSHSMFLLAGDGKYVDVLERVLYNAFLAGVGFGGREFFHPNPLASDGIFACHHGLLKRQPWFHTACCPTNVVRFMPLIPELVYATTSDALHVNLFVASAADFTFQGHRLSVDRRTRYPWDGRVELQIDTDVPVDMELRVRIPGWSREEPVASDLYAFCEGGAERPTLHLNGGLQLLDVVQGHVSVNRTREAGDAVVLDLPMPAREVACHPAVKENRGRLAVQRGRVPRACRDDRYGGRTDGRQVSARQDAPCLPGASIAPAREVPGGHGAGYRGSPA